jgi:hypothetical protein
MERGGPGEEQGVSGLFYSIKWPEIGPFWGVDLLYRRPSDKVVTGGLVACGLHEKGY